MSEEDGFKVNDRRILGADGQPMESATSEPSASERKAIESATGPVEISFSSFVLSLSTSAMVHMGAIDHPSAADIEPNLEVAKQEIQIIEMLQEKTKGNLDDSEKSMVEDVLFHLRVKFLEKSKA